MATLVKVVAAQFNYGVQSLEVGELFEVDDCLLGLGHCLLARQWVMVFESQHDFVEDFGLVFDEGDFVGHDVELLDLSQVDSCESCNRLE